MQTFVLKRDGKPRLGFVGEQLASAKARWREAFVFQTQGGKFVVHTIRIVNGVTRRKAAVVDAREDIIEILGQGLVAKRIYGLLGIDNVQRVV